ncbi:MAG: hypothetical protein WBQ26_04455 [Gemmatimonadaceae bacterium]|nr:hypothetical protein [Gemmatimonadaceae bacterium]
MSRQSVVVLAAACLVAVAAGCSNGSAKGAAVASGSAKAGAAQTATGNACDRKLLTAADVAGILTAPIVGTKPIPGDPQTCQFTTGSFPSISVTLRPGLGKTTVDTWTSGRMPVAAAPLAGVGDEAAWVDPLHEVVAEKNNLLCDIQVTGTGGDFSGSVADQQRKIGALCNKIFAAVQ